MEESKIVDDRRVEGVKMGFFCQHKMAEVNLTLSVAVEKVEAEGKAVRERRKLLRRKCELQDESCDGCREIERITAKLEFFDL